MNPWRSARHHLSFKDLETSAKDGCEFCELLKDGILDTYTRRDPEDFNSHKDARDELFEEDSCSHAGKEPKGFAYASEPGDRLDYGQYILRLSGGRGPTCVRYGGNEWGYDSVIFSREKSTRVKSVDIVFVIGTQPSQGDLLAKMYHLRGLKPRDSVPVRDLAFLEGEFCGREITREPNLQLARGWINWCQKRHNCEQFDHKVGPSRLLCLRTQGKPYAKPRLVETNGGPYAYVCLSHRWSSSRKCITSTENYEAHLRGVDLDSLPKTFLDAIHTTLGLGYDFLWIDSLCIIQDDPIDWVSECPKMGTIYGGGQVTITAPAAVDSESGFLEPRFLGKRALSCALRYRRRDGTTAGKVRVWYAAFTYNSRFFWTRENSVLDTRGWILQERLLSSRVLYFGSRQLYLECNVHTCFEMLQYPIPPELASDLVGASIWKQSLIRQEKERIFHYWLETVDDYQGRNLTFQMDKLPALSGIASVVRQATGDEYLAGLWRADLAKGLVWKSIHNHRNADPSLADMVIPYRAPTWSWARSDCGMAVPVYFLGADETYHLRLQIISAHIELASSNPFGQVKNGYLQVRAKVRKGVIRRLWEDRDESAFALFDPVAEGFGNPLNFDADNAQFASHLKPLPDLTDSDAEQEDFDLNHWETLVASQLGPEDKIEVLTILVSQCVEKRGSFTYGLVLLQADQELAYSRVGIIHDDDGSLKPHPTCAVDEWFSNAEEKVLKVI